MKNAFAVLALIFLAGIGCNRFADEKKEGENKPAARTVAIPLKEMLDRLNLTDQQKAKVNELTEEFSKKVKEVGRKMDAVLTAEQKQIRDETIKSAVAAGKTNRAEVAKAVSDAIKLTAEQIAKMQELNQGIVASQREMVKKIKDLLTPEQSAQLKNLVEKRAAAKAKND
jgi:Spy/CpxP family protein refolding chaperone